MSSTTATEMVSDKQTLSVRALSALVVGSMVGAGIFTLPAAFGRATGVLGAMLAWLIAGTGMLMLAFVFQSLAQRKPELDSGVFAYAKAGFGNYLGFLSALGFWAGSCVGNTSYFVLIKSTLGRAIPAFGEGNTVIAVIGSSILLWLFHFLILRGVQQATGLNNIITVAKIVPISIFILILIFNFNPTLFSENLLGGQGYDESLFAQVRSTMLVTVFVFLGIEGASIYSRYAEKRSDVGKATVTGFLIVLCLLILVTVLPYGVLPREELGGLRNPSMAAAMEAVVGRWGSVFISAGLLVSVLGAYLAWTLFAAEVPFMAAKAGVMPQFLTRENSNGVPAAALWMTSGLIQFFLIVTLFSEYAFQLALELTSSLSLVPYLLVAAYGWKLAMSGETYGTDERSRRKELMIAVVATLYSLLMLYAGGLKYLLLSALIYAPGTLLFYMARREQNRKTFTFGEWFVFSVAAIAALSAFYALITGQIAI